jgi:hypothetical protein
MTASRRDPHLGELAAALVDGALDHNARDRALAHVLRCDGCRLEVETQRRLKSQLLDLAPPPISAGLAERLRGIPDRVPTASMTGLPPARFEARFRTPARLGPAAPVPGDRVLTTRDRDRRATPDGQVLVRAADRPISDRPAASRPATAAGVRGPGRRTRSRRRRIAATAAGGLAAFALSLTAVAVVGSNDEPAPVAPQVSTFIVEHDLGTKGMPGTNSEVGVADAVSSGR